MTPRIATFPVNAGINLVVRLGYGSISISARDDVAEALVRLTPQSHDSDAAARTSVEMQGSTLVVAGPRQGGVADLLGGWWRKRDGVDTVIEVPAGTPLKISSASEDIAVTGRCADTDIATTANRISLEEVTGDLRLRYGEADSRVAAVAGSVQLSAARGRAEFGEVGGSLQCKFGSGDLNAGVIRGDLRARAGNASADLGAVYGNVDLAFGSGSISIGLPVGIAAYIDIMSGSGQAHSDLPVEQSPTPADETVTVRARTGSGEIRVQRAA
jgi:hypothetical protein